ncbi:hypothetical protein [Halorhabdus amylolytica]|uniref:hypothetical protein n=1 Tax=Halorhabdus amylolytica TaxID=2559573 RepID=UPI0010AAEC64|nr:hypothetical protein [Halorhabdus amylolytica]
MAPTEPTAPDAIAQYITDGLERQSPDNLRTIAAYAEDLAAYKEAQAEAELEGQDEEVVRETSEEVDDLPDEVPGKASVVIKEINDNRYYYYQWRDGEKIRSKYKAPVNPSE